MSFGKGVVLKNIYIRIDSDAVLTLSAGSQVSGQLRCNAGCKIEIGQRTLIRGKSRIHAHEAVNVIIGDDCILHDFRCRTSDSHKIYMANDVTVTGRLNRGRTVMIGDRVYCESGVHVYKGVSIGSDSYIQARSIIVKSFAEEGGYIAGSPAQLLATQTVWFKA
ncbi:MAG: hypothetical protein VXW65_11730 [Pseudomonadota bacterium]|nr:hypothetical protein [Pseudomonadota bacterium]